MPYTLIIIIAIALNKTKVCEYKMKKCAKNDDEDNIIILPLLMPYTLIIIIAIALNKTKVCVYKMKK